MLYQRSGRPASSSTTFFLLLMSMLPIPMCRRPWGGLSLTLAGQPSGTGALTWRGEGTGSAGSADLLQEPGAHVVDEAAHVLAWDEGAGLDAGDRLPDVPSEVVEGLEREGRPDAGLLLHLSSNVVVLEGEHPAVGVMDEHDLLGAEQPLGDEERADRVLGDHPAGVADDVSVSLLQTQDPMHVDARVHAGDDGQLLGGWRGELPFGEALGVASVVLQQLLNDAHPDRPPGMRWVDQGQLPAGIPVGPCSRATTAGGSAASEVDLATAGQAEQEDGHGHIVATMRPACGAWPMKTRLRDHHGSHHLEEVGLP